MKHGTIRSRTRKLVITLILVTGLVLLMIFGNHEWPIAFDWDDKAGFKSAYLDLPDIHPPALRKVLDYILVPQSKHFIASYFRSIKWKAARGTAYVWTLGGTLIVVGLPRNVDWSISDPYKTELMDAAEKGNLASVKNLIHMGAKIDEQDQNGRTALIYGAAGPECKMPVIRALICAGANVNSKDKRGKTPLHEAAAGATCVKTVEILIAAGGDVNAKTNSGETPLMLAAVGGVDESTAIDMVKTLIAAGADVNARDSNGDTALSLLWPGRNRMIKLLTEHSAKN